MNTIYDITIIESWIGAPSDKGLIFVPEEGDPSLREAYLHHRSESFIESSISYRRRQMYDRLISGTMNIDNHHLPHDSSVLCISSSWKYIRKVLDRYHIHTLILVGEAASQFGSHPDDHPRLNHLVHLRIHYEKDTTMYHDWPSIYLPQLHSLILTSDSKTVRDMITDWKSYPSLKDVSIPIGFISKPSLLTIPQDLRYVNLKSSDILPGYEDWIIEGVLNRLDRLHTLILSEVTNATLSRITRMYSLVHLEIVAGDQLNRFPLNLLKDLRILSLRTQYGFKNDYLSKSFQSLRHLRLLELNSELHIEYPDYFDRLLRVSSMNISLIDSKIPRSLVRCASLKYLRIIDLPVTSLIGYPVHLLPDHTELVNPRYGSTRELLDAFGDDNVKRHKMIHDLISELLAADTLRHLARNEDH